MSNTEVIKELQKIIDGNTCSWNQMSIMEQAIKLLSPTPSKELIHEYFDNCSTRPAASIESKELKSAEDVLECWNESFIGTRISCHDWIRYKDLEPEVKECIIGAMEEYAQQYASKLHPSPTPDVEDGKQGGEELPDKIKKIIEEESYKEEIYPKKYGSGSRDGYNTMMLYEINSERSECFSKGAEFGYRLAQPSTPVQDGWVSVEDKYKKALEYILTWESYKDHPIYKTAEAALKDEK